MDLMPQTVENLEAFIEGGPERLALL
jgi:hypothetical protein